MTDKHKSAKDVVRKDRGPARMEDAQGPWPSFSIVVPTYRRREMVCDCLRALFRLDYAGAIELIVVVDGSTDGTREAIEALESPFALRIIAAAHGGAARARNLGAAAARNDILLFLDDDMLSEPDLVARHAEHYRNGTDAVTGDVFLDPNSPRNFITEAVDRWIGLPRPSAATVPFHIYTGQLSVRRSVFNRIGGFDEAFTTPDAFGHEDTAFGVKLLADYRASHEPSAITRQRYLIGPREAMRRAPRAAAADLLFATRFPNLADHVFDQRGQHQKRVRFVYRPLSRIPLVSRILAGLAVVAAERALNTRFRSSRLLGYVFFASRAIVYWSAIRAKGGIPSSRSLLILCYHAIEDQSGDPVLADYGVDPATFTAQLESLARRGFTFIGPEALRAFVRDKARLPRRAVLLTFDDGYDHLRGVARDVLRPRGIEAIAFAVTGVASRTNEWDRAAGARSVGLLDAEGLKELCELGVEIGAHSRTHRLLPNLDQSERTIEVAGPREDMIAGGLRVPRFFAYPYGASDRSSRHLVEEVGYEAAFGVSFAYARHGSDPFLLPRVPVLATDRHWRFRLKTSYPAVFEFLAVNLRRAAKVLGLAPPSRLA